MAALQEQLKADASAGRLEGVQACLAAGADPNARDSYHYTPLHWAAYKGHSHCVAALLAAGADPCAATYNRGLPAHLAARANHCLVLRQLAAATPAAVQLRDNLGRTPLQEALHYARLDAARTLLTVAPQQPAAELLGTIAEAAFPDMQPRLYTLVAAHQPLLPDDWALIPARSLGAVLPCVLQRSTAEVCLLVQHLLPADRARLRAFAMCLWRAQRFTTTYSTTTTTIVNPTSATTTVKRSVVLPPLPTEVVWRLLALSVA